MLAPASSTNLVIPVLAFFLAAVNASALQDVLPSRTPLVVSVSGIAPVVQEGSVGCAAVAASEQPTPGVVPAHTVSARSAGFPANR